MSTAGTCPNSNGFRSRWTLRCFVLIRFHPKRWFWICGRGAFYPSTKAFHFHFCKPRSISPPPIGVIANRSKRIDNLDCKRAIEEDRPIGISP
jgi:hypothetical protein